MQQEELDPAVQNAMITLLNVQSIQKHITTSTYTLLMMGIESQFLLLSHKTKQIYYNF